MTDYKKCKFKTTPTSHVEMNKTAKREICRSHKRITSEKKEDLLMLCKNYFCVQKVLHPDLTFLACLYYQKQMKVKN